MVSGFNTNIRHRGVLFHVQTEASGVSTPHILSHLFKGGNILASMKGDYSANLELENLEAEVRTMMENQHKTMLRALTRGEHDEAILSRVGKDAFADEKGPDADVTIPPPDVVASKPVVEAVDSDASASPIAASTAVTPPSPSTTATTNATPPIAAAVETSGEDEASNPVSPKEQLTRMFGDGVVSQKPLDEVVLDFLVDNARKRKRSQK
ncbi:MAG: hypothetical protein ACI9QQ_001294 [Myxococcota bacterium]|jgi:hypothetical protein